jgi:hypothetical protein
MHPNILQSAIEEVCDADRGEGPEVSRHLFLLFCTLLGRVERALFKEIAAFGSDFSAGQPMSHMSHMTQLSI